MLHLRNVLNEGSRVVDVGGSIGMAFYMALKYFEFPANVEWVVYDVPAVLEAGRKVALREADKSAPLRFVPKLEDAGECNIFLSAGSLQLIEESLPELLQKLPRLPEHILINRVPVWDKKAYVSLNDMGFSLAPYNIFNRSQWVVAVERLGYSLIDEWKCPESKFKVRFRPSTRLDAYRGFYFRRLEPIA
jgi:putative methyltransferase (TIGR04325 family)